MIREIIEGLRPSELRALFALSERSLSFSQLHCYVFGRNASKRTVWLALNRLKELGLIEVEERPGPRNRPHKFYKLKEHVKAEIKKFVKETLGMGELEFAEGLIEAREFIGELADIFPDAIEKRGKKYVVDKDFVSPYDFTGVLWLLIMAYRFFMCISEALREPTDLEGYAERLKRDFVEMMEYLVDLVENFFDAAETYFFVANLERELRRIRGMLFALLFMVQDPDSLLDEVKWVKKFLRPPEPVKNARASAMPEGEDDEP